MDSFLPAAWPAERLLDGSLRFKICLAGSTWGRFRNYRKLDVVEYKTGQFVLVFNCPAIAVVFFTVIVNQSCPDQDLFSASILSGSFFCASGDAHL